MKRYKKHDILRALTEAKTKHERWVSYVKALYNGIPVSEEYSPLTHTDCEFGKWMLENKELLYYVDAPKCLDDDHKAIHNIYLEIHKLLNEKKRQNIFFKTKNLKNRDETIKKKLLL